MSLENARQTCRFMLSRIEAQVEELLLVGYPGNHVGPRKWINVIVGVIETAKSYVEKSEDKTILAFKAMEFLRDANNLAETAYSYTKIISGAGPHDLPYAVVQPLQRWFSQAGLNNDVMFRSDLVANYEIRSIAKDDVNWIRDQAQSLDEAINDIIWPLQCFTVPAKAFGMLPHFAIVAHEIGHAIYHQISWNFANFSALEQDLDQRVLARSGRPTLSPNYVIIKRRLYLNWLQELVSDACGHLIAGPAFFFAVCGLLQSLGGGFGIGFSHPSNDLRRKVLFKKNAETNGFSVQLNAFFLSQFKSSFQITEDINSEILEVLPTNDVLYKSLLADLRVDRGVSAEEQAALFVELPYLLENIISEIYSQAEDYIRKITPELIYDPVRFRTDLEEHYAPLLQAIPPIETGPAYGSKLPADITAVLNVGWIVLLAHLDKVSVKDYEPLHEDAARFEKLHSLLLKGLELSEARRSWADL